MSTVYDLRREDLTQRLEAWGEPAFRAKQVWRQLWTRAATYDQMPDIPGELRERLATELPLGVEVLTERTADRGATRKALLRLGGEHVIETVLMGYLDRVTVCATGQMGLQNNLTAGEIAAQAVWARRQAAKLPDSTPQRLTNVVFMGMGEPIGGCLLPSQKPETQHVGPATNDFARGGKRPFSASEGSGTLPPTLLTICKRPSSSLRCLTRVVLLLVVKPF